MAFSRCSMLVSLGAIPFGRAALAAEEGESIIAAAKGIGNTNLKALDVPTAHASAPSTVTNG
jgi:hypothetical protein